MELPSHLIASMVGAVIGVASHLGYFIHGEHHKQAGNIIISFAIAPILLFLGLLKSGDGISYAAAATTTAVAYASYFTALSVSILAYRAFFHPLRKFPGPFTYKLSKLFQVASVARTLDNCVQSDQLRLKYGNFVRVGPNELIITTPEAVQATSGYGSKCTKSPWYDGVSLPSETLQTVRDRSRHDIRRRVWDRGFGAKALRNYESRVTKYADLLMDKLETFSGKPINASLWLNFFAFDVMGDLTFGKSFDMLKSGEMHFALKLLEDAKAPVGMLTPIPWILPVLLSFPGAAAGIKALIEFGDAQIVNRKKNEPENPDIFSWLIDAEKNSPEPINRDPRWMTGDCRLIIVAGSDTTAATLTFIMYHLAQQPDIASKLREELKLIHHRGSETEVRDLQEAKYLNGVINESLRLHPPIPSGVFRQTPPEGITVNDTFIPGNVTVSCPMYSLGRLESCFQHADQFLPERWGDKPELVRNKAAFIPFSTGVYSCIGKPLALMEIRTLTARIVGEFDINFAPGEDGTNVLTKSRDVFALDLAPLMLVFTKRS